MPNTVTPWTTALQASLPFTLFQSLLKPMFIESVMPANRLVPCRPLLLPSIFPSIRIFSNESALCTQWQSIRASALALVLQMSIQGLFSLGLPGLISLQSKRLSKSLLQHHSWKASILWHTTFFMDQLSHPYMTTSIHTRLDVWTFVSKVMSLLF